MRYKTLADRIANSTCLLCGEAGRWKRKYPKKETEMTHFAQDDRDDMPISELLESLPAEAVLLDEDFDE